MVGTQKPGLWLYGKQVEDVSRKYLDLRHRLLPYIYSGAADVTLHGSTLMRPLVMDFAQDDKAMEQKYEFMFGKELLVAPVLAPGVQDWDVYLPKDQHGWINFWTGKELQGGQTVRTSAKLDELPLFVRAGSIVPIGPTEQWVNEKPDAPIEFRVYPGADATFSLYEDEGTNYNYEKGAYSIIPVKWNDWDQQVDDRKAGRKLFRDAESKAVFNDRREARRQQRSRDRRTPSFTTGKQLLCISNE